MNIRSRYQTLALYLMLGLEFELNQVIVTSQISYLDNLCIFQGVDPGLKRDQGVREGPVVEVVAEVPENLDRQPPRKEGVDLVTGRDPHHESVLHLERGNDLHLLRRERIRGQHHVRGRDRHPETREDLLLAESQHLVIERGQLLRRRDQYHLKLLMDARVAEVVAKLILCWWLPL